MTVTALVFDVFGTVVDWRSSVAREVAAAARRIGVETDGIALADAWRAAYAPSMDRVRKGELPWTTIDGLHRAALDALLPRFGLAALDEAARDHLNRAWHRLDPWPDSVAGLRRLRHRYTLATLSNGNVALLATMAKHARLPWDVILSAELFGHYKPDAEVYDGACRLLDLPPAQVMMVAAHNGDLRAAAARGLATAFVARPTEYGPAQTRDLAADGPWDVVCASFTGLASALGC
ncbi:haloacid dehalogenase type II [Elioraea tepidiphila]|uniref:haloacid dehalogenase type II n=1 Tax=Elioraea tepidiphila TaxID=457934 RepID=UPI0003691354|nr:haloacid dehalogenase type II [Elioraea tepidiphila]